MSWEQLLEIGHIAAQEEADNQAQPPTACPNDGEPLRDGPNGELFCISDGWVYQQ